MKNEIKILNLPSIDYKKAIDEISEELKNRLEKINIANLVCNEETVKTIKDLRSELNKEYKSYEEKRVAIKKELLKPYEEFELLYNEKIKTQYLTADSTLKESISNVETKAIQLKTDELKEYFKEHQTEDTEFITFEKVGLNILLSATTVSLKKQIVAFFEKVNNDLELIKVQENNERILNLYRKTLDVTSSIVTVANDIKSENELKKINEEKAEQERLKKESEPHTTLFTQQFDNSKADINNLHLRATGEPSVSEEYTMTFKVKATKEKLKALKQFMESEGIIYE